MPSTNFWHHKLCMELIINTDNFVAFLFFRIFYSSPVCANIQSHWFSRQFIYYVWRWSCWCHFFLLFSSFSYSLLPFLGLFFFCCFSYSFAAIHSLIFFFFLFVILILCCVNHCCCSGCGWFSLTFFDQK